MALIKDRAVADDIWQDVSENDAVATDGPIIVSLDQWGKFRNLLSGRNEPLGIRLRSDQAPSLIEDQIHRFDLIALEFPSMADGRAFSYARLLRERYEFKGEIRAVGDVHQDQIHFMRRCGIDSYQLPEGRSIDGAIHALDEFSVVYQPAADADIPATVRRHRRE